MKPQLLIASPLPPVRSEIANNVVDSQLPALVQRADVTLVAEQQELPDLSRCQGVPVLTADEALKRYPSAQVVAHLGNHYLFSASAMHALERRPGFAVLHDLVMHHAFYGYCYHNKQATRYVEGLKKYYGTRGEEIGVAALQDSRIVQECAPRFPLFEPYLENALGVIVHSRLAFETLAQRERWPVCHLNLPYQSPNAGAQKERLMHRRTQAQTLADGGALNLIVFGHLSTNRGLPSIIEALAILQSPRVNLNIYGTVENQPMIEEQIRQANLQKQIFLHGYVSEEALDAALNDAHVAINLRSPTMGEASASQLRIYAAGLPSIVTRDGWYAEQPESAVYFLRKGNEVAELVATLKKILNAPNQLLPFAASALDYLSSAHSPEGYALGLLEFIASSQTAGLRLLLARHYVSRVGRVGDCLGIDPTASWIKALDGLLPSLLVKNSLTGLQ